MDGKGVITSVGFGLLSGVCAGLYAESLTLGIAVWAGLASVTSIIDIGFRALLKEPQQDIHSQFVDRT